MRLIEVAQISPQRTGLCMRFFKKALLLQSKRQLENLQTSIFFAKSWYIYYGPQFQISKFHVNILSNEKLDLTNCFVKIQRCFNNPFEGVLKTVEVLKFIASGAL